MWIAALIGLALVAWFIKRYFFSGPPPEPVAAFAWPELGHYDFEVVGESNYQRALKALRDTVPDPNEDAIATAILVPEDNNPHDNKAVRVTVQGYTIGYLSRDDARSYRRRLAAKKLGMVPASCEVLITGGHLLEDGSRAFFGAQLDMKPFD
jgi:hypothetical protein